MTNPKDATEYYNKKKEFVDNVSHPSHYTNGEIECIDAIKSSMDFDSYCGYLKGNVIKYIWRCMLKNNPVEDLRKANWYLTKWIRALEDNANASNS